MSTEYPDHSDDILESSISALRARPIPDGPSDQLMAQTVAAMRSAAARRPNIFRRMTERPMLARIAAGLLLVVGIGFLGAVFLRQTSITCAEVIEKVRSAHAMSLVMDVATPKNGTMQMTMIMNDQGQATIKAPDGSRIVTDVKTGKVIVIQPAIGTAIKMNIHNMPKNQRPDDMIESFKKLSGKDAKDLGPTEIDGRKAEKFLATQDRQEFTVWADRETGEPIRIDMTVSTMGQKLNMTCTQFVLNPQITDDEFSQEIPKGYTLQEFTLDMPNIDDGEGNLVGLLRGYAARADGKFPPNLDDTMAYMKLMMADGIREPSNQDLNWIVRFQMVQHFLGTLPKGGWRYLGNGKTTAEKNSIIFWYRTEKGYRGIYGNLTVSDLSAPPK
jgi:outer membrane lipoprotein-sorting protein